MKSGNYSKLFILSVAVVFGSAVFYSCGMQRKVNTITREKLQAQLVLPPSADIPDREYRQLRRDTIVIHDDSGKDIFIMKAIPDEATGDMVANDVLDAAYVSAKFRNLAERNGKVDLRFALTVPAAMLDSRWQLRFYPDMYIMQDSVRLEPVYITGKGYRNAQLRGYEQYRRFLSTIITDTTRFIDIHQLEVFLQRNIPEVYAFRNDTSFVSDEMFYSVYGVNQQEAVDHYTYWMRVRANERRKASKDKMFNKYVKSPIVTEGIRLDSVVVDSNGDFIYHYVQTINTRPKLRRVDIVLSGDIWEDGRMIYRMPRTDSLTFYISSVSAFADMSERYLTRVIERRAEANASYRISFLQGKSDIRPDLGDNYNQIDNVKQNLSDLLSNEVYDLDSIVVVANASPEGTWKFNDNLSRSRGKSVVNYFQSFMDSYRRDAERNAGFTVDATTGKTVSVASSIPRIRFITRSVPENWPLLDRFVRESSRLSNEQKEKYFSRASVADKDRREQLMKGDDYYRYLADSLYPRLRTVDFAFHLHRKDMIKDTIHTTELDQKYMEGVRLLKDMEYEEAVKILGPYQDYNAAVAYTAAMRNASALLILEGLRDVPQVKYLKAIIYARMGNEEKALQNYVDACRMEPSYVHRGNLDPEISGLIKLYGLNRQEEDDYQY